MTVTGLLSVVAVRLSGPVTLKIVAAEASDAAPKATLSAVIAMIARWLLVKAASCCANFGKIAGTFPNRLM